MRHSWAEVALGAAILAVAAGFLIYGYRVTGVGQSGGAYVLTAEFTTVGALKPGDAVRISGVKVGAVSSVALDPQTYRARVTLALNVPGPLPADSSLAAMSESLMGGLYLELTPGGEEETLPSGGRIQYTQPPQNLEQLLGKFIFTMQGDKDDAS